MKINLENMPALFYECGELATATDTDVRETVRKLSARCALFAGVVQKVAAHLADIESRLASAPAAPPVVEEAAKEKSADEPEETAEPINPEASQDLDAEARALAAQKNERPEAS